MERYCFLGITNYQLLSIAESMRKDYHEIKNMTYKGNDRLNVNLIHDKSHNYVGSSTAPSETCMMTYQVKLSSPNVQIMSLFPSLYFVDPLL
jgi:hypothetical protein